MDVGEFCDNVVFYSGSVKLQKQKNICVLQILVPQKGACYVITDMLPEFHQCK